MSECAVAADWIVSHIDHLASEAFAAMYTNPFWDARFGERGRLHALKDQRHHLDHLVLAVRWGQPRILIEYAKWLQVVLTSRGMCTRHLVDNFSVLGDLMAEVTPAKTNQARQYLETAVGALSYQEGPEGVLHAATETLIELSIASMFGKQGATSFVADDVVAQYQDDLSYHLSYLADALALGRSELFAAHIGWTETFFTSLGKPPGHLYRELGALDDVFAEQPNDQYLAARTVLLNGINALGVTGP